MKFGINRYLERSRLAAKLVEDWQLEHQNAMFAHDVDELVAECLQLESVSKETWDRFVAVLFSEKGCADSEIDALGMMMKTALEKTQSVFEYVWKMIDGAQAKGYSIVGASDFAIALQEVRKIKDDVDKKLPPVDRNGIEQALADFKKGAFRTAEDLLREAQGCSS